MTMTTINRWRLGLVASSQPVERALSMRAVCLMTCPFHFMAASCVHRLFNAVRPRPPPPPSPPLPPPCNQSNRHSGLQALGQKNQLGCLGCPVSRTYQVPVTLNWKISTTRIRKERRRTISRHNSRHSSHQSSRQGSYHSSNHRSNHNNHSNHSNHSSTSCFMTPDFQNDGVEEWPWNKCDVACLHSGIQLIHARSSAASGFARASKWTMRKAE